MNKKIKDVTFHIFDTETTGKNENDKPIELSIIKYKLNEVLAFKDWLINPGMLIHPSARAIHGISDEMLVNKPSYQEIKSEFMSFISDKVVLAHNIDFDLKMVPDFNSEDFLKLDILTLAKKVFKIGDLNSKGQDLTSFQSQELRYWLELDVDTMGLPAHRATADVIVSAHVFNEILNRFLKLNLGDTIEDLKLFHDTPIMLDSFNFGKYKGRKIEEALEEDKKVGFNYILWLMPKIYSNEFKLDSDMLYSIEHHLKKVDILKHFKKDSKTNLSEQKNNSDEKINPTPKLIKRFGK